MDGNASWTIITALAATVAVLAGVCWKLMGKLIHCHEMRVKQAREYSEYVQSMADRIEAGQEGN